MCIYDSSYLCSSVKAKGFTLALSLCFLSPSDKASQLASELPGSAGLWSLSPALELQALVALPQFFTWVLDI